MELGSLLILVGAVGVLAVVFIYPAGMFLSACCARRSAPPEFTGVLPQVTVVTAVRNSVPLLKTKIENFRQLDYPPEKLVLLVASDASTDDPRAVVEAEEDPRIRLVEQKERYGKASALNRAVSLVQDGLLLFSDVDAQLRADVVHKLVRHLADGQVGGVCGQRVVRHKGHGLHAAQQSYIRLDSALKRAESVKGRISSNDGKIHMIRRELFRPIPPDVTDDLYTALSVISQGYRFVFEPEAVAEISVPSRDVRHEVSRRRRIVTRSLTGILRMRRLLNPLRFGWFAVGLLINKIGRRFLPFFVLMLMTGLVHLIFSLSAGKYLFVGAGLVAAYCLAAWKSRDARLLKPLYLACYVTVGLIGSAWGAVDFIMGRRVHIWEPKKTEVNAA